MIDRLLPDPKCLTCRGTGNVRAPYDCPCLLREAKSPLWRRAIDALVGDPCLKGRSMVAGRREFLKTLATGAVTGVAAVVLPKPIGISVLLKQDSYYDQFAAASLKIGQDAGAAMNRVLEHRLSNYSIYGQNVLESSRIVIVETS